ncbi:MAG: energy transducer TonB [Desulfosalsimonas sp.]|uniref:energy transducer TonB n=1 Tax=Desulfosalsimonas sp. TaxID=3073848 RepID=UPI00397064A0
MSADHMAGFRKYFQKINWLFWMLVIFSVGVHLCLFWQFRQVSPSSAEKVIEVTVDTAAEPEGSPVPNPPARPPDPAPDMPAPEAPRLPEIQAEDTAVPEERPPEVVSEQVAQWQGPETFETVDDSPEPPKPAKADADVMAAYFSGIRAAIERNKQYPAAARQRRQEGRVIVSFDVDSKGRVSDPEVVESSGFSSLDNAAVEAVRAAGPFDPPPPDAGDPPIGLEIPIVFQLRR